MDDEDDGNMDMDGYGDRNFNDYNDNSADHMGIVDDDISQPPIAKGLPTKFMFRGMRGQRQYDVPQIGECQFTCSVICWVGNNQNRPLEKTALHWNYIAYATSVFSGNFSYKYMQFSSC